MEVASILLIAAPFGYTLILRLFPINFFNLKLRYECFFMVIAQCLHRCGLEQLRLLVDEAPTFLIKLRHFIP